jgi:hypothetical protein
VNQQSHRRVQKASRRLTTCHLLYL